MDRNPPRRRPVTVFLSTADFNELARVIEARGQSRADLLRDAIHHADVLPIESKRRLSGACLVRQQARLRREKRAAKKGRS